MRQPLPAADREVRGLRVAPLPGRPVTVPGRDADAQFGDDLAGLGGANAGFLGHVADEGHIGALAHFDPPWVPGGPTPPGALPPCRTAHRGTGRALPLWITSPRYVTCGQPFAIRKLMRKDARPLARGRGRARGAGHGRRGAADGASRGRGGASRRIKRTSVALAPPVPGHTAWMSQPCCGPATWLGHPRRIRGPGWDGGRGSRVTRMAWVRRSTRSRGQGSRAARRTPPPDQIERCARLLAARRADRGGEPGGAVAAAAVQGGPWPGARGSGAGRPRPGAGGSAPGRLQPGAQGSAVRAGG